MKTTVEIDDALLRSAKRAALDRGITLRAVLEAALRREVSVPTRRRPLKLVTVPGGLPPGLDISSRKKMQEWFDADAKSSR